jgi:CheY-like chemotaxis protein
METTQPALEKRLLVVEDNESIRDLFSRYLAKKGYAVQSAVHGNEALEYLQKTEAEKRPKIILMDNDVETAQMTARGIGLAALEKIKQLYNHDISVILMSARTFMPDDSTLLEEAAKSKGAYAFLQKPLSLGALIETIDRCYQETISRQNSQQPQRSPASSNYSALLAEPATIKLLPLPSEPAVQ